MEEPETTDVVATHGARLVTLARAEDASRGERAGVDALQGATDERFRSAFEATLDAAFIRDASGRFVEVNSVAARRYGYSRDELLRMTPQDLTHPEAIRAMAAVGRAALDTGLPFESRHVRKDGSDFPVEVIGCPFEAHGRAYVYTTCRDITERKRAQLALQQSEDRFAKAFYGSPVGMVIARQADGRYLEVNESFLRITGCRREEVVGHTSLELGLILPQQREPLLQQLKERGFVRDVEITARNKAGEPLHLLASIQTTELGGELCAVTTMVDLSERKRSQEHATRLETQLYQAQKMEAVGQLAGGIAHDFNNLLAAIVLQLDLLRRAPKVSTEHLVQVVDEILGSAQRAAGLTRQLLLFSRRQALQACQHDLNVIVTDLSKLLERLLGEQVAMQLSLRSQPLWIDADASMIEQVLTNLCVNARDAMPKGGGIAVTTRAVVVDAAWAARQPEAHAGLYACLQVTDTGSGIEPALLPHIFEPFFTTKGLGRGTGLGLATVHGIVAKHGGFVEVQTQRALGTTFSVYLPSAAASAPARERPRHATPNGGSEHVLVVEDEPGVRRMAGSALRALGYRVSEAADALAALQLWDEHAGAIDLLFTDLVMPGGIGGLELCERLRARKPGLRALVTSGYSDQLVADDGPSTHNVAYLPKPYTVAALGATIRECLDGSSSSRGAPPA